MMMIKSNYNIPAEEIDRITETIYLGNYKGSQNFEKIIKLGITKVISVIGERPAPIYPKNLNIQHKIIPILDSPSVNVIKYFKQCLDFMDGTEKVLVHCYLGASRSATFVIAFLMWKNKLSFVNAFNFTRERRRIVFPNNGFLMQLRLFENILRSNNYNISNIDFSSIKYTDSKSGGCCHA